MDTLKSFFDLLRENWGWVVGVFCLFFEIAPIKLHPITFILGWVGRRLTGDLKNDMEDLRRDVDMQRIAGIRALVLDFANSCMNKRKHSKEEFENIINENKVYEKLVQKYEIKNDVYAEDYAYVKRVYRKCLDEHKFLVAPTDQEMGDE